MGSALASAAYDSGADVRVGSLDACPSGVERGGQANSGTCGKPGLKKFSAIGFLHGCWGFEIMRMVAWKKSCGSGAHVLHDADDGKEEGDHDETHDNSKEDDQYWFND